MSLLAGQVLGVEVEQLDLDVSLQLKDLEGRELVRLDSPNNTWGTERFWWSEPRSGSYVLVLRSAGPPMRGGRFRIRMVVESPAEDPRHRFRVAATTARSRGLNAAPAEASALFAKAAELWLLAGEQEEAVLSFVDSARRWRRLDRLEAERAALDRALVLARSASLPTGPWHEMLILRLLGSHASRAGDAGKARAFELEALDLAKRHQVRQVEAACFNNLGLLDAQEDKAREALEFFRRALALARSLGDTRQAAIILQNLGASLVNLGRNDEAVEALSEACTLGRDFGDPSRQASCSFQLAWALHRGGRSAEGLALYQEIEGWARRSGESGPLLSAVLDRSGTILQEMGRLSEAYRSFGQALAEAERRGDLSARAHSSMNLAEIEIERGAFEQATRRIAEAAALLAADGNEDLQGQAQIHLLESRALAGRGMGEPAVAAGEQALALIEELRRKTASPAVARTLIGARREYLDHQIRLLVELDRQHPASGFARKAFETFDLGQARTLIETLAARGRAGRSAATTEALDRWARSAGSGQPQELDRLIDELVDLRSASTTNPGHRPAFSGLESLLDEATLLVAIHLGASQGEIFTAHKVSVEVAPLAAGADELADEVSSVLRSSTDSERWQLARARLSTWLLGPIVGRLDGVTRVVVVTEGALLRLPFALLENPRTGHLLADDIELVKVPSAATLAALRRRALARRPGVGLAVFADPLFEGPRTPAAETASTPEQGLASYDPKRLRKLPASGMEARAIARLWPERPIFLELGDEATERAALDSRLRDIRILHFATHTVLDPHRPELSGLALTSPAVVTPGADGLLSAFEISASDYSADLVVLSACRSAIGPEIAGEGLIGLPRAFLEAGATSVLTSLWPVEDEVGAAFMEIFYRHLALERGSRAAALRSAQREFRKSRDGVRQSQWAGFELVGDWAILETSAQPEEKLMNKPTPLNTADDDGTNTGGNNNKGNQQSKQVLDDAPSRPPIHPQM